MGSWKELKDRYFTPEEQAEIKAEALAEILGVKQPTIARMERRTDMYLSSLRGIIQAMGGDLEIVARFPDGAVRINQFRGLEEAEGGAPRAASAEMAAEAIETYRPSPSAKRTRGKPTS